MDILNSYVSGNLASLRARLLWCVLISLVFLAPCYAASTDTFLDASIDEFVAQGGELYKLCRKLNQPCGEESAFGYKAWKNKKPELRLKKMSPRNILNEITQRHPGHQWIIQDGVLILEPLKRSNRDLLGKKLAKVSIHGKSSLEAALEVFRQAKIGLHQTGMGCPLYAHIDLELKDVTVREALNAIVKADGQVMWQFIPTDVDKDRGSFTMSSWRKSGFDTRGKFRQETKTNDTFLE